MAASFPTSYDALTNPSAGSLLTSPSHSAQHTDENDILEAIEQRVGLSGTGFPGGPSSGQFFNHTTRDIDYFYDGTRWLSQTLYVLPLSNWQVNQPYTTTQSNAQTAQVPWAGVYDLWLEHFQAAFFVAGGGTALGASHKWVVTLVKQPAASTVATINIDSGASATWRNSGQVAINALVGTTNFQFTVSATETGTPGDLNIMPTLTFRLVG